MPRRDALVDGQPIAYVECAEAEGRRRSATVTYATRIVLPVADTAVKKKKSRVIAIRAARAC